MINPTSSPQRPTPSSAALPALGTSPHGVDPGGGVRDQLETLVGLASDLAGEFRLQPLLERILRNAVELLGCESGSLCTIDEVARVYRKEVDLGIGCRSGELFPIEEGVTGAVVRAGGPVTFDQYSSVPGGHISPDDPRYSHPVIGVPIRVKSMLIGACVVFGRTPDHRFDAHDTAMLELFATHAAVAISNSRLHGAASERAKSIAIAAERERSMREVHDVVGRSVASVLLRLDEVCDPARSEPDRERSLLAAREAAASALGETERAVRGLGPSLLDRCTIEEAIALELDWASAMSDATTHLLVVGERLPISPDVAQQLFRIVQEGLANAVAHAAASSIRVGLLYGGGGVSVIVEDDGRGFDTERTTTTGALERAGLGITGLLARAQQVGGVVRLESTIGWGTRLRADLPYSVRTADDALATRWRVLVVHDQPVTRSGLVALLGQTEPGVQVVGELADPARAVDAYSLLRPDVVLADIQLPGMTGAELVTSLRRVDPGAAVVLLVGARSDERVRAAAQAGARGFVDRAVDAVSLGRAVISAVSGDVLVSGGLLDTLGGWPAPTDDTAMTPRERQVRMLVEQGLPDKQIAARLGIAVKTVEKHVGTVLRKSGARNRTVLAALASGGLGRG